MNPRTIRTLCVRKLARPDRPVSRIAVRRSSGREDGEFDLDLDADLDLACSGNRSTSPGFLVNDGSGSFRVADLVRDLPPYGYPDLLVDDVDRDGDLDVAFHSSKRPPLLYRNLFRQVHVHDALAVRGLERFGDLPADPQRVVDGERAVDEARTS